MLTILSPAKKMDFVTSCKEQGTKTIFNNKTNLLAKILKNFKVEDLEKLMSLSHKLSVLNYDRFQNFNLPENKKKPAIFAFRGDTYKGFSVDNIDEESLVYANKHIKILSGLYGVLSPLNNIQPYRLEMGTKLKILNCKNLYEFWKEEITNNLNQEIAKQNKKNSKDNFLINLASKEYFSAVDFKKLNAKVLTPIFKEKNTKGVLKIISFNAKRARGRMARYIVDYRIDMPEKLKNFNLDGYHYEESLSSELEFVFVR